MLTLTLRRSFSIPLEVEGITPDLLQPLSLKQIEQLETQHGNQRLPLAEFFKVTGDPSDWQVEWQGELTGVHWIGAKMNAGSIHIAGSAGRHVGSEMRGGKIEVAGSAGDWLGCEMRGGEIHVHGNAGDLVGGAYRGSTRGMRGGKIVVVGNVGEELGLTMRRGLIVVQGSCGDLSGMNMLAGTIVIGGQVGLRPGAGMKRGTIICLGDKPRLLPTFRYACTHSPAALRLLATELANVAPQIVDSLATPMALYSGDFLQGGRGEIFVSLPRSG